MLKMKSSLAALLLVGSLSQSALALTCPPAEDLSYSDAKGWSLNTADSRWNITAISSDPLTEPHKAYFLDTWWDIDYYDQRPICIYSLSQDYVPGEEIDILYSEQTPHPDASDPNWYQAYDDENLYICEAKDPSQCVYPD